MGLFSDNAFTLKNIRFYQHCNLVFLIHVLVYIYVPCSLGQQLYAKAPVDLASFNQSQPFLTCCMQTGHHWHMHLAIGKFPGCPWGVHV